MKEQFNIYRLEAEDELYHIYAKGSLLDVLKWCRDALSLELDCIDSLTLIPREKWSQKKVVIQTPEEETIEQTFEEYVRNSRENEVITSTNW